MIDRNIWFVEFLIWRIIWTLYPSFLSSILYFTLKKIMFKKQIKQWASRKRNDYFFIFRLIRNTSTLHCLTLTAAHGNFSNNLKYSFQSNVQKRYMRHSLQNNFSKIFYFFKSFIWHALFCSDYPVKWKYICKQIF